MIIVTGGAGFIGSVLVREINSLEETPVVVVDRFAKNETPENLKKAKVHSLVDLNDLFSQKNRDELWPKVTKVFHLGACSSTTETDWNFLLRNNVEYSQEIFKACIMHSIPLVYASSAATYGDGEQGYNDSHDSVKDLKPLNLYGKSKQDFDLWALEQKETPPVWFGLKYFNVYGPNEYHKGNMRSMVNKAFDQIRDKGQVKLFKSYREEFGDGEQSRDFIYVRDAVRGTLALSNLVNPETSGIYNMGTGVSRSFLDLIKATFKALNCPENIEFIEMPDNIKGQYQYFTQANMDKFKSSCPDFKFLDLEDSVKDYVQNFLDQTNPYY